MGLAKSDEEFAVVVADVAFLSPNGGPCSVYLGIGGAVDAKMAIEGQVLFEGES